MSNVPLVDGGLCAHPLANLFPMIEGAEARGLAHNIGENGLNHKIVLLDGMILDGRNRYIAAIKAGLFVADDDPERALTVQHTFFKRYDSLLPPMDWVLSENLHRRHLSSSQRAMVAQNIATFQHGGARRGESSDQDANLQLERHDPPAIDRKTAADMMHVSVRSVADAAKVANHGVPELTAQVQSGQVSVNIAAQIAELSRDEQAEIIALADPAAFNRVVKDRRDAKTAEKKAARAQREANQAKAVLDAGGRKFSVIVCDPEWRFETHSEKGLDRSADNHYPTSSLEAIMARDIPGLAAKDCVLGMWTTTPQLACGNAHKVLDAYGFEGKSVFYWDKKVCGNGYWFRDRNEVLILATRGKPVAPAMGDQFEGFLSEAKGTHSAKPEHVLEIFETYFPNMPKIELNRRGVPRDGWWAWGNETKGDETRGITLDDNGFADASHLPLLPAASQRILKVETDAPTPKPKPQKPKPAAPMIVSFTAKDTAFLAAFAGESIKFYATAFQVPFPAASGWFERAYGGEVTPENALEIAQQALLETCPDILEWRLSDTAWRIGRSGVVPLKKEEA